MSDANSGGKTSKAARTDDDEAPEASMESDVDDGTSDEDEDDSSSSSEEDSSSDDGAPVKLPSETLLQGRARRKTAGQRMAELLNAEEDETFYKETYGDKVFEETNSDFEAEGEESWDELDTDFDEDEGEDEAAADEPDEEFQKKRNVYIDPLKPAKRRKVTGFGGAQRKRAGKRAPRTPGEAGGRRTTRSVESGVVRKSKRSGSVEKGKARVARNEDAKKKAPAMKKPKVPVKKLTQTERLRQAVKTERENTLSLMRFKQKEASKKKAVLRKTTFSGPVIRYHSKCILREDGVKEAHNFLSFTQTEHFLETYFPGAAQLKPKPPRVNKPKTKTKAKRPGSAGKCKSATSQPDVKFTAAQVEAPAAASAGGVPAVAVTAFAVTQLPAAALHATNPAAFSAAAIATPVSTAYATSISPATAATTFAPASTAAYTAIPATVASTFVTAAGSYTTTPGTSTATPATYTYTATPLLNATAGAVAATSTYTPTGMVQPLGTATSQYTGTLPSTSMASTGTAAGTQVPASTAPANSFKLLQTGQVLSSLATQSTYVPQVQTLPATTTTTTYPATTNYTATTSYPATTGYPAISTYTATSMYSASPTKFGTVPLQGLVSALAGTAANRSPAPATSAAAIPWFPTYPAASGSGAKAAPTSGVSVLPTVSIATQPLLTASATTNAAVQQQLRAIANPVGPVLLASAATARALNTATNAALGGVVPNGTVAGLVSPSHTTTTMADASKLMSTALGVAAPALLQSFQAAMAAVANPQGHAQQQAKK